MAQPGAASGYYNAPPGPPPQMYGYANGQPDYQQTSQLQGPPPGYQNPYDYEKSQGHKNYGQQFALPAGPKWHDIWAGLLFLLTCAGFVAVSGISIQGYAATKGFNGDGIYGSQNGFGLSTNTIVLFAFCLGCAFILSIFYLGMARLFPKAFIWITGILNIVFGLVTAVYMLSRRYWSGGIVFLVFSIFTIICFISWIPRIPFSALMLTTSVDVSKRYGHVYFVSLISGILATAFGAWFSVTLVAIYAKYEPGNNPACSQGAGGCSSAKVIGLIVFATFAAYWITEWLKITIHTIISGVYGSWYYSPHNFPRNATRGAARRALTYSFGSISLGSLFVALINMLRQACSIAQNNANSQGNLLRGILFCILGCLIGILDWAVQFINRYAFSYIALKGKSYFNAAKDTWTMIKDRGIDALVNECLLGPVFTMGASFVGYACALLAYLYLLFTSPAYNSNGSFTPVVVAFAYLIGLQMCQIFVTPISSGIDTIFVAMAFDPAVMMNEHPELYNEMVKVYPRVQEMVRV